LSKDKFDRKILFNYLQDKYEVTKLPKQFFIKMSNIFKGKLDGLSKPIPPEHMYDMWIRKSSYLDKVNSKNISKGKKLDNYARLNYDLAIIISKYDDYLSWLDRQKAQSADNSNLKESVVITEVLYSQSNNQKIKNTNEENNFADLIDELI